MPVFQLSDALHFPPPHMAISEGLLAVGGDLSSERLLLAYESGIFPWYSKGDPILWWAPDPRLVLYPDELHISRSLRKTLRKGLFTYSMDSNFDAVIRACADARGKNREDTWITEEMIAAYIRLHQLGYAHSVEVRHDGRLVGGLYGISLGRAFFGESMFSAMSDASKAALVALRNVATALQFHFIDCQLPNDHLIRMGARNVSRSRFLKQLAKALKFRTLRGIWRMDQMSGNLSQTVS